MKNKKLQLFIGFILISIIINITLSIIAKIFNINFFVSNEIGQGSYILYQFHVGNHLINITQTIVNTWAIMLVITLVLYFGTKNLSVTNPGKMQVILESLYLFIEKQFLSSFGSKKKKFMPFFAALFLLIAFANLSFFLFPFVPLFIREGGVLKIVPFFRTFTADLNSNVAYAFIVTIMFIGIAIKKRGILGYIKELSQPFAVMLPINLLGELAKPVNITVRLFGNMVAGLVILGMIYALNLPNIIHHLTNGSLSGPFSLAVIWPIFLQLYMDLFVGVLQAFVFTVLASVYIGQSIND